MARILSIEVETSQVRVAEVEDRGKKNRIFHAFRFPAPRGAVEDGMIRDTQSIGETLKRELAARRIKTKKVCYSVSSSRIASREVRIPFVKQNRIQSIIEANATDYFPIDVSKYVMSYAILNVEETESEEGKGKEKQFHLMVFAAPKSISAAYRELSLAAGLTAVRLDFAGNSILAAVSGENNSGTHLYVKIEEKSTLITVVREGVLALQRTVNYGVDAAIETVRAYPVFGTDLDTEGAYETLLSRNCIRSSLDMEPMESEAEDTDDFVREARREVTESLRYLIGNVSRIMDYYLSRHQEEEFASVTCCGMGAEFTGLAELFTNELGVEVRVLERLPGFDMPRGEEMSMAAYAAVAGAMRSNVNLLERATKKEKAKTETMGGGIVIFSVCVLAAAAFAGSGIFIRMYHQNERDRLNARIEEEKPIEEIYNTYNATKDKYDKFQIMYDYTNTPNEHLKDFIEELEEKMPSAITVDAFSSTGTEVSFSMRLTSKSEAANTLIQLRTFGSLSAVTTTGMSEGEDGTVTMSVTCTYSQPAPIDSGKYNQ